MKQNSLRAGIFVLLTLLLMVYIIIKVGSGGLFRSGYYTLTMDLTSAVGLDQNTQVQVAGVTVGKVDAVTLTKDNLARLKLAIRKDVSVSSSARGVIRQTGILGDSFVEIVPGDPHDPKLKDGGTISDVTIQGDLSTLTGQFSLVADDVKAITKQMRKLMAGDESSFAKTMKNIEKITESLSKVTGKNEENLNAIIANLKILSQNLNYVVARNMGHVSDTMDNLDAITTDVQQGKGTIGRLLKDEDTVEKLNETLESLNEFVGGANRMQVEMGAHSEYLGGNGQFKNYVSVALQPRPDKYFLFEVNSDPDPSYETVEEVTEVTSGGATNTVEVAKHIKDINKFRFSLQVAKKFENLTIRGGLIESSGGIGLDYDYGPLGLKFSAYDFKNKFNQKPHFKLMGTAQLTRTFYLLGGLDDFVNTNQDLDWFLGGGIRFTDDDIKSLLGMFAGASK